MANMAPKVAKIKGASPCHGMRHRLHMLKADPGSAAAMIQVGLQAAAFMADVVNSCSKWDHLGHLGPVGTCWDRPLQVTMDILGMMATCLLGALILDAF